jgi:hypothetical protein
MKSEHEENVIAIEREQARNVRARKRDEERVHWKRE